MRIRTDPVLPDQGGRHTPADPLHPLSATRDELVREKAYEIYEQRGRVRSHEFEQWLEAERELTGVQRRCRDSLVMKWSQRF